ncbi:MAG: SulP family inorganic anion transporter [Candidatus Thiodiazotropha sp.]
MKFVKENILYQDYVRPVALVQLNEIINLTSFYRFQRPEAPFKHIGEVVPDAVALAIVVFAVSISMAKILAKKRDYEVDANQVCIQLVFLQHSSWVYK